MKASIGSKCKIHTKNINSKTYCIKIFLNTSKKSTKIIFLTCYYCSKYFLKDRQQAVTVIN